MRIIITGTPGTGKTSISKELSCALGCKLICVNDLVKKERLYSGKENGEYIADFGKLRKRLSKEMKINKNIILESHLLCDLLLPADLVIVFRCEPKELERRLKKRGYGQKKVNENVMSEILDYCYIHALENYGAKKVMQIDSSKKIGSKLIIGEVAAFENGGKMNNFRWLAQMGFKTLDHYS
jgi:adenylate kinase